MSLKIQAKPSAEEVRMKKPVFSIEDKMNTSEIPRKLFYDVAADTAVLLCDGKELKFNKAMLCENADSAAVYKMFYGELADETPDIKDIDYDSFKLFVDCVMGFAECDFDNAVKILPVAWKYQSYKILDSCLEALEPLEMNEAVIEALNFAVFLNFEELIEKLLKFVVKYNLYRLLDKKEYSELLEIDTMKLILTHQGIDQGVDSHLMQMVINWAKNYLKNNDTKFSNVKDFLISIDLLKIFELSSFETTSSFLEFFLSEKDFFSLDDVLQIIRCPETIVHKKSEWRKAERNSFIAEVIVIKCKENPTNFSAFVRLERNKVVYYENRENKEQMSCNIQLELQNKSGQVISNQNPQNFNILLESSNTLRSYCISYQNQNQNHSYNDGVDRMVSKLVFKITYTFLTDCRILLTNRPGDSDNTLMYYTSNISFSL